MPVLASFPGVGLLGFCLAGCSESSAFSAKSKLKTLGKRPKRGLDALQQSRNNKYNVHVSFTGCLFSFALDINLGNKSKLHADLNGVLPTTCHAVFSWRVLYRLRR